MDIRDMKEVESGSIDAFVALHVLNHVRDDDRAVSEIARILDPASGVGILTVPCRRNVPTEVFEDATTHYGDQALRRYDVGTFRRYGLLDLRQLLEQHFSLSEFSFVDPLTGGAADYIFELRAI
jgi:SAM-dependent methyltransferase